MPLDRKSLLARKTKVQKPRELPLPSGESVLMRVPTGADYRSWKKFMRDEKGEVIDKRADLADELLVASILVDSDGKAMFTREDVLNGAMDEILQLDLEAMKDEAYRLYGQRDGFKLVLDEDREKNSSGTAPSA